MNLHETLQDLKGSWRTVLRGRRLPFKLGVIATLAIAIGANIAVLGNLGMYFGQVVPGATHQNLYQGYYFSATVSRATPEVANFGVPPLMYRHFAAALTGQAVTALYRPRNGELADANGSAREHLDYMTVTPSFTNVLGIKPLAGRVFDKSDMQAGATPVVIIAARVARARFRSAPEAIDKLVKVDGETRQVVGVFPDTFVFPTANPASAWIPFPPASPVLTPADYLGFNRQTLVRPIQPLTSAAMTTALQNALQQALSAIPDRLRAQFANAHFTAGVTTLAHREFSGVSPQLQLLELAALILLILVLANLASLTISDAFARRHELATRVALGARPLRLYGERLRELLPLGVVGWAIGIGLGWLGSRALKVAVGQAGASQMALSATVLLATLGAAALIALVLAMADVRRFRKSGRVVADLSTGPHASGGRKVTFALRLLVVIQLVASLALLITTAHLQANVYRLQRTDFGFATQHRIFFSVSGGEGGGTSHQQISAGSQSASAKRTTTFGTELIYQLKAIPAVQDVAVLTSIPLSGNVIAAPYAASPNGKDAFLSFQGVSNDVVSALGLHILAGNPAGTFVRGSNDVFLDAAAARHLWPHSEIDSDIGKTIYGGAVGSPRVVAIVQALQMFPYQPASGTIFYNLSQSGNTPTAVVVHSTLPPAALRTAIVAQLAKLDPGAKLSKYTSADDIVNRAYAGRNRLTQVFAAVALVTLLISAVGLFSLLAYRALVRRAEFAIRSALGASPARLSAHVLGEAALLWIVGCVIGLPVAYALSIELAHRLPAYGTIAVWLAAAVAVALGAVAMIAALTPALWSGRTAPAEVLRQG